MGPTLVPSQFDPLEPASAPERSEAPSATLRGPTRFGGEGGLVVARQQNYEVICMRRFRATLQGRQKVNLSARVNQGPAPSNVIG